MPMGRGGKGGRQPQYTARDEKTTVSIKEKISKVTVKRDGEKTTVRRDTHSEQAPGGKGNGKGAQPKTSYDNQQHGKGAGRYNNNSSSSNNNNPRWTGKGEKGSSASSHQDHWNQKSQVHKDTRDHNRGYRGSQGEHKGNQGEYRGNNEYRGNQSDHKESQGEYKKSQGEYKGSQSEYKRGQSEYRGNQGEHKGGQGEYKRNQGEYRGNQGDHKGGQGEYKKSLGEYRGNQGEYKDSRPSSGKGYSTERSTRDRGQTQPHYSNKDTARDKRELEFEREKEEAKQNEIRKEKEREEERAKWEKERAEKERQWKEEQDKMTKLREKEERERERSLKRERERKQQLEREQEAAKEIKERESKFKIKGKLGARTDEACMTSSKSFGELKVMRAVCDNLSKEGITHPLPLQTKCLPQGLKDYDVYALAKEGTGKVLTWAIIALQRMLTKGGGGSGMAIEPGILVLVPHQNAAENGAEVLTRLNSPGPAVSLYKGAFPERAMGAEVLVVTMDTATALLNMNRLSLKRVHTLVVDECTSFDRSHADTAFPTILKRLKEQTKDNKTEVQIVAFTTDMSSPIDRQLQPFLRRDKICYHSVLHALPASVGVTYTFLQLRGHRQKMDILPQVLKVPGMDKIVVICCQRDVAGVRSTLNDVPNYATVMWADADNEKQHEETCSAMRSDGRAVVVMTPACYEVFDHDREEQDVAMYLLFDPESALQMNKTRRRLWSRSCRVFMTMLLSSDSHTDASAAIGYGNNVGIKARIHKCHPYETSVVALILDGQQEDETIEPTETPAPQQVQHNKHQDMDHGHGHHRQGGRMHNRTQQRQPQQHQNQRYEGRSGWKGYTSAGDTVDEAIAVGKLDQAAKGALNKISLEEAATICRQMLDTITTLTNPSSFITARVNAKLKKPMGSAQRHHNGGGMSNNNNNNNNNRSW